MDNILYGLFLLAYYGLPLATVVFIVVCIIRGEFTWEELRAQGLFLLWIFGGVFLSSALCAWMSAKNENAEGVCSVAYLVISVLVYRKITSKSYIAERLARAAEDLIRPVSFYDTHMQKELVRYFEDRLSASGTPRRAEIISFYKDESRVLYAVMIVAYESLLFSDFAGTERHCGYHEKEKLKEIFRAAAERLVQKGYGPAEYVRKADDNILAVKQFCADRNGSFRLFD